jgi:hypothetical protein
MNTTHIGARWRQTTAAMLLVAAAGFTFSALGSPVAGAQPASDLQSKEFFACLKAYMDRNGEPTVAQSNDVFQDCCEISGGVWNSTKADCDWQAADPGRGTRPPAPGTVVLSPGLNTRGIQ